MSIDPNNGLRKCNGCGRTIDEGEVYMNGFFKIRENATDIEFGFYDLCPKCRKKVAPIIKAPSSTWVKKQGVV